VPDCCQVHTNLSFVFSSSRRSGCGLCVDTVATAAASDALAGLCTAVVGREALLASPLPRLRFFFLKADDGVHAAMELLADDNRFRGRHGGPTRRLSQRRRLSAPAATAPPPQPRRQMLRWRTSPMVLVDLDTRAAAVTAAAVARLAAFISAPVALGHSILAGLTSARRWGGGRGGCGRVSGASRPDRGRRRGRDRWGRTQSTRPLMPSTQATRCFGQRRRAPPGRRRRLPPPPRPERRTMCRSRMTCSRCCCGASHWSAGGWSIRSPPGWWHARW